MSKRRRAVSPVAVALISDQAYRSTPIYTTPIRVAESVATVEPTRQAVREAGTAVASSPGRMRIALIRSGWSLNSVYYPADVLARDGARAWPAGTKAYIDHATDAEEDAYPSGTIKNLAAVLTTDAQWNPHTNALEAEVRLFAPWRETLTDMAKHIGMSIRAWVYAEQGEAEGRKGLVVSSIESGRSVDFVTEPAAGGAILSVLESARRRSAEARNIGAWLESRLHLALTAYADDMYGDGRLTREERIVLSGAIGDGLQAWSARVEQDAPQLFERDLYSYPEPAATGTEEARRAAEATVEERRAALASLIADAYGDDNTYTWVRDFDPDKDLVWFDVCPHDGASATYQQAYTVDADGQVALDGDRVEVVARTVYDPVSEPADPPAGGEMPNMPGDMPMGEAAESADAEPPPAAQDVTDGAPPTAPNPPTEEEPEMSGTQTGAPPVQAGTATVADTPPAATAEAANTAVLEAMQALTRQVTALTEANAVLARRADERDAADRAARNRATAREAVEAALNADTIPADLRAQIAPRVTAAVLASIPAAESGDVDTAALGQRIAEAVAAESGYAAQLLESAGVGRPTGLGSQAPKAQTAEEFEAKLTEGFRALGLSAEAAAVAAKGRG